MIVVLSVSEINAYLRQVLESDDLVQDLWVRGEVSNFVQSQAGHIYFTLKDDSAQLRCVIFRGQLASLSCLPKNGLSIVAHGRLSVYEVSGQVQLYVDLVQPQGVGALYLQFERLRRKLEGEGLFDPARKRALPRFPKRVGVATSPTGAALQDVLKTLARRFPAVEVVLSPTLVQGADAAAAIVAALAAINQVPDVDVMIIARGGGSLEDLWPFNEEVVARAIYGSRIPVICGVGHETDVTIADMVADVRAPTPTAAAAVAVPDRSDLAMQVESLQRRADLAVDSSLASHRLRFEGARAGLMRLVPPPRVLAWRQQSDELAGRAEAALRHRLAIWRERTCSRELQLGALSPTAVLERGYSICWHPRTGRVVKAVAQVAPDDDVQVQVADGLFAAVVSASTAKAASFADS